jgi:molybdopterin converting factor small subunit
VAAVTVLLFSLLREGVGSGALDVPLLEDTTAGALLDRLAGEHAVIAKHKSQLRVAVNEQFAPLTAHIRPGDTVALLLPVSGG